jgi:hypothetical protein
LRNINGLVGDLIGSILFSFFTVFIINLINGTPITHNNPESMHQIITTISGVIFSSIILLVAYFLNNNWKDPNRDKVHNAINTLSLIGVCLFPIVLSINFMLPYIM